MWKHYRLYSLLLQCLLVQSRLVPSARPKGYTPHQVHHRVFPHHSSTTPPQNDNDLSAKEISKHFDPLFQNNNEFCANMAIEPIDFPVIPWWYRYCIDMMQTNKKKLGEKVDLASVKRYMEQEMKAYKELETEELRNYRKQNRLQRLK